MMADLDIDLDLLDSLQGDLRVVRREFDNAERFSEAVADMVGHDALAGTVRDFASKWNLRREELLEELDHVAGAATAIHDTMVELDMELSSVLANYREGGVGGGGGGGGGGGR